MWLNRRRVRLRPGATGGIPVLLWLLIFYNHWKLGFANECCTHRLRPGWVRVGRAAARCPNEPLARITWEGGWWPMGTMGSSRWLGARVLARPRAPVGAARQMAGSEEYRERLEGAHRAPSTGVVMRLP